MTQHINISAAKHKNSHTGRINEDYKLLVQGKLCNQQFMLGQDFCQNCGNLKQVENTVQYVKRLLQHAMKSQSLQATLSLSLFLLSSP